MRDNVRTDDLIKGNLVIVERAQRITSKRAWTFCLWTSRAPQLACAFYALAQNATFTQKLRLC